MKRIELGTMLALFMSLAVFSFAQQSGQDSAPPNQEQPKHQQAQQPRHPDAKSPQGQEEAKPPQRENEEKPSKTEKQEATRPSGESQKPAHEQHGTEAEQRRPAGKSGHIPDPQFKASFGKQHAFTVKRVVTNTTTIVPNQTRFVYSGYTFVFLDPWPADWQFTDDCYVDYVDDEYFLFNALHPGVRVALFVME